VPSTVLGTLIVAMDALILSADEGLAPLGLISSFGPASGLEHDMTVGLADA
jgi:hypothetical protein